jgi:hypothetical protein
MQGSYIPLPRTQADRQRDKDSRRSIEERYQSRDHYLDLVSRAAQDLAQQGYLLQEDLPAVMERAGRHWNYVFPHAGK